MATPTQRYTDAWASLVPLWLNLTTFGVSKDLVFGDTKLIIYTYLVQSVVLYGCSPSVSHPSLGRFDSLRSAIERITNSDLSDTQWLQASLPVRDGLGVRRVASLALPAFVASAASTLPLQDAILMNCVCSNNSAFQNYLSLWSSAFGPLPEDLPPNNRFGTVLECLPIER